MGIVWPLCVPLPGNPLKGLRFYVSMVCDTRSDRMAREVWGGTPTLVGAPQRMLVRRRHLGALATHRLRLGGVGS